MIRALVAREQGVAFEELAETDLPKNGVTVDVAYSSLNYKDGLAVTGRGRIVRKFPMVLVAGLTGIHEKQYFRSPGIAPTASR